MSTLVLVEAVTSLGPLRDGVIDNVSDAESRWLAPKLSDHKLIGERNYALAA